MALESALDYSGFGGGSAAQVYNEAAFRYFLAIDRSRLRRLERSIVLVLVSVRQGAGRSAPIADTHAAALFDGLAGSVREVDFIGWYQHGRVAGAVLPQAGLASREERRLIAGRIGASLQRCLPRDITPRLHVRAVCLGGKVES